MLLDSKGKPIPPFWIGLHEAKVEETGGMRMATDDWPFLYTRQPTVPGLTLRGIALTLVLSGLLWFAFGGNKALAAESGTVPEWGTMARSFFLGAGFMLVLRSVFGANDSGAAVVIFIVVIPVALALLLSVRFPTHVLGPHESKRAIHGSVFYAVATGWLHGARTALAVPTVAGTLGGLASHRMVLGINTMLVLVMVRHGDMASVGGLGTAAMFFFVTGIGAFIANVITPIAVGRWGRYRTANGALLLAAGIQLGGVGLQLPMMVLCGFLLGAAGQVVKLCADTAMQIDVDDALRGHMFAVQDALFWMSFIIALTAAAAVIPADGRSAGLVVAGSVVYLVGLAVHAGVARRAQAPS